MNKKLLIFFSVAVVVVGVVLVCATIPTETQREILNALTFGLFFK